MAINLTPTSLVLTFRVAGILLFGASSLLMIIGNNNWAIMDKNRKKGYFFLSLYAIIIILVFVYVLLCFSLIKNDKYIIGEDEEVITTINSFDEKVSDGRTEYYNFSYDPTPLTKNKDFKKTLESPADNIYESADDTGYVTKYTQHRKLLFFKTNIYTYRIYLPAEYYEKIHDTTDTVNLP